MSNVNYPNEIDHFDIIDQPIFLNKKPISMGIINTGIYGIWCLWRQLNMKRLMFKLLCVLIICTFILSMGGCRSAKSAGGTVTYNLGHEPETIDPALTTSPADTTVILACFEGLMKLDTNNKAIPGIAASYRKESDTRYVFRLRNAKWSDGKAVTARDFEYAWKRALSPELGSYNAYQLYYLKNGESYNKKKASADAVGVRAIDDNTLQVDLEHPSSYFLELLSLPSYMPLREDIISANPDKWAKNPFTYICNGPFRMSSWKSKDSLQLVKNENFYDAENVKLYRLVFKMEDDPDTYLADFEIGNMDIVQSPPTSQIARLAEEKKLNISPDLGVYYYSFNCSIKPLSDIRVRKALAYSIDRNYLIHNVTMNAEIPASAFVPGGIPDANITKDFRNVGGNYFKSEGQISEAKKLLSDAGYPGGRNFPELTLTVDNSPYHSAIAKALQNMWNKNLGIKVNAKTLNWRDIQKARRGGSFQIIRDGWIGDYMDPMTFMNLLVTGCGNNDSKYSSKTYDTLIDDANKETDQVKRMALLHNAEKVLMNDMPVVPIFFYSDLTLINPDVKGVIVSPMGYLIFENAYLVKQ